MKRFKQLIYLSIGLFSLLACEEEVPTALTGDGNAPGKVSNVTIENRNGGAKLTYSLPDDANLLYVKAVYEYPKGNVREVRASAYVDSLVIEGIGDTQELGVSLFSVSRSEKVSESVQVTILPMTPPVQLVAASLEVSPEFGGISVHFLNERRQDIIIEILKKVDGDWTNLDAYYTNSKQSLFTIRGQEATPTEFGLYVRDKWKNKSDTLLVELTPLYEVQLPSPTPVTILPNDYNQHYAGLDYTYMFDEVVSDGNYMGTLLTENSNLPLSFTLDFGSPAKFSRFRYWMRQGDAYIYNYASPETWEVWGSNELTADWENWTKIMDCRAVKPSGPGTPLTAEDRELAARGLVFPFPAGTEPYRYIRWKTMRTFGALNAVQISELAFYGGGNDE